MQHGLSATGEKDLLALLDIRSSSLSELLAKLEGNDSIVRQRDEDDRRGYVISVKETDGALPELYNGYQAGADTLFAALSDEERNKFGELLKKVIASAEDHEPCRKTSHKPDKHEKES